MSETAGNEGPPPLYYVGPYESWVYGNGKKYAFPAIKHGDGKHFSALINWRNNPGISNGGKLGATIGDQPVPAWIPLLWKGIESPQFTPMVFRHAGGLRSLTPADLDRVLGQIVVQLQPNAHPAGGEHAEGQQRTTFRVNFPVADASFAGDDGVPILEDTKPLPEMDAANPPPAVIVAVIDDGIPFAHRNFLDSEGKTRLDFCWLQSAERPPGSSPVLFGREFSGPLIDALRAAHPDEDDLYHKAGAIGSVAELKHALGGLATHGAHVLDAAAGNRPGDEKDPLAGQDARIIAVQLPNTIAWDTSGFGKEMYMLSAFHYIFDRADRIAARFGVAHLPLVINFSYGFSGGSHDGRTELEMAIDELILKRRTVAATALVMPSGNTFLDRLHGIVSAPELAAGGNLVTRDWRLQPNDRTPSYLEIWFPTAMGSIDEWGIEIADPAGHILLSLPSIRATRRIGDWQKIDEIKNTAGEVIGQFSADDVAARLWRILVILAPTEPEGGEGLPYAEPGRWTLALKYNGTKEVGPLLWWIQRDEDPAGYFSGARQSFFDDPLNVMFNPDGTLATDDSGFVRRYGTLNGLATGKTQLVVGGFVGATGAPASYSSAGPQEVAPGSVNAVSAASISDASPVLSGVNGAGSRSGSFARWSGTSAAAPRIARALAGALAKAPVGTVEAAALGNYVSLLDGIAIDSVRLGLVLVPGMRLAREG